MCPKFRSVTFSLAFNSPMVPVTHSSSSSREEDHKPRVTESHGRAEAHEWLAFFCTNLNELNGDGAAEFVWVSTAHPSPLPKSRRFLGLL